jgi:hypothetical protein
MYKGVLKKMTFFEKKIKSRVAASGIPNPSPMWAWEVFKRMNPGSLPAAPSNLSDIKSEFNGLNF